VPQLELYADDLRRARLKELRSTHENFKFYELDIAEVLPIEALLRYGNFDLVYHLAALAGVKASTEYPHEFTRSNCTGFVNILEACRKFGVDHLICASSSSVYGDSSTLKSRENAELPPPKSFYAATKRANELMAATYSHLHGMQITMARMFTVYGPWGRPDMATYKFTKALIEETPITIYNNGLVCRDFTYIDDVVSMLDSLDADVVPQEMDKFQIYNVGSDCGYTVNEFLLQLEQTVGKKAITVIHEVLHLAEVPATWADMSKFKSDIGTPPHTPLRQGLNAFVDWYKKYHKI
jgi:UDP-glucuronate 4-epimerase